jgi:hypothetical protein
MEWPGSGGMEWHGGIHHRDTGLECLTIHAWAACGVPPICMVYLNPSWQKLLCTTACCCPGSGVWSGLVCCCVALGEVGGLIDAEVVLCE